MPMIVFTIFTSTYNRAYIIEQLYHSIQRQTFRNFEWLIIDDGSTDDTEQLVRRWINEENDFSIRYYRQENKGKCRSINKGVELARGEMFLVIDSDDYLTDDALTKLNTWKHDLPQNIRYCGISGNMGTDKNGCSNTLIPGMYYDGTLLDRYHGIGGERVYAFYTDIHREYLYPVFDDEKFMTEAVVWNRMAHDGYQMRFYDDVICIYEYQEDGLTRAGNSLFLQNPQGYGLWLQEKEKFLGSSFVKRFRMWYSFYCEMTSCEEQYRLTKKQCAEYIKAPALMIYALAAVHFIKNRKKENT